MFLLIFIFNNDSLLISYFINDFANSGDIVLFIGAGDNIAKLAKETAEFMIGVKQWKKQ